MVMMTCFADEKGICVERSYCGTFCTSLEMPGVSITLLNKVTYFLLSLVFFFLASTSHSPFSSTYRFTFLYPLYPLIFIPSHLLFSPFTAFVPFSLNFCQLLLPPVAEAMALFVHNGVDSYHFMFLLAGITALISSFGL